MTKKIDERVLAAAAKAVEAELEEEFRQAASDAACVPDKLHKEMLELFREADTARKAERRRIQRKKYLQTAAAVLICTTITAGMTMNVSEGFRKKVFRIFNYEQEGAVELRADEEDLIGDWSDYWYPTYLPEGYKLAAAEEIDHFMLFQNEKKENFRVFEEELNAITTVDTDTTQRKTVKVGTHEGFLLCDSEEEGCKAIWTTDSCCVNIYFDSIQEQNEIIKILNNMKFVD